MMRLFFFLLCFACRVSFAQTDSIQYFDALGRRAQIDNAVYYRKISKSDTANIYLGTEYWMNGYVKMVGYALDTNFMFRIGKCTYYYKGGGKSGEGQFYSDLPKRILGFKNKKWETWYADGKPKEVWIYKIADDFSYDEGFLGSFGDTTGKELTSKGEGKYFYADWVSTKDSFARVNFTGNVRKGKYDSVWTGYYTNGKEYTEEQFKDGKFLSGKSFDAAGNVYLYDTVETGPRFPGDEKEWNKFIMLNSQPQKDAKLVANVSVRFFIGKNGFAGNILELHAPKYARDEVSRILKLLPRFIPATTRGQQVDSYYTAQIPVALTY
jgi:hypothetical protein